MFARVLRGCGVIVALLGGGAAGAANIVSNSDFNVSLSGWTPAPGLGGTIDLDTSAGSPAPYSARLTADVPGAGAQAWHGQCLTVRPLEQYVASANVRVGAGQASSGEARVYLVWYTSANCSAGAITAQGSTANTTTGSWEPISTGRLRPPAGAHSMRIEMAVKRTEVSGAFYANFDHVAVLTVVRGDFDGNGQADLLLDDLGANAYEFWLMSGAVRIATAALSPVPDSDDWEVAGVEAIDVGDEQQDLLVRNAATGELQFWFMNGTSRPSNPVDLSGAASPSPAWQLASTGHFDGDRSVDLVWRDTQTQKLVIWKMNGTQKIGELTPNPDRAIDGNWSVVATLDFNGDGHTDFLWYNPLSGKIVFWFMDANVVRITGQFANPPNAGNNNWKVVAAGDYGAGPGGQQDTSDIVWRNETSGNLVVWFMDNAGNRTGGGFTTPAAPTPPLGYSVAGPR